jgi:hypothetical protein
MRIAIVITQPAIARVDGRFLTVQTDDVTLILNTRRGLAIESLTFPGVSDRPLVGTLPHGYYDDISLGADFYTGHLTLEPPGAPKVTDLERVDPEVRCTADGVEVSAVVPTAVRPIRKRLRVGHDGAGRLTYGSTGRVAGGCRLGHVTLVPTSSTATACTMLPQRWSPIEFSSLAQRSNEGGVGASLGLRG